MKKLTLLIFLGLGILLTSAQDGNDKDQISTIFSKHRSNGGYGGIYLEPILAPRLPVHISIPLLFGIGGITNVEDHRNWDNWVFDNRRNDVYLVFEPAIELEFNMTRHVRLACSAGNRFTSDIEMENTNPEILEGINIGLVLKFGRF